MRTITMMHRNRSFGAAGFTLIELLLACTIFAGIGLAISSTFSAGLNVYKRVEGFGQAQGEVLIFLEKFDSDLRNVVSFKNIPFSAEGKKIEFATLIRSRGAGPDSFSLGRVEYLFDDKTNSLLRIEQPYPFSPIGKNDYKPLLFTKDVNFSYCYFDSISEGVKWKDHWDADDKGVPIAVKVKITFDDNGRSSERTRTVLIPVYNKELTQQMRKEI